MVSRTSLSLLLSLPSLPSSYSYSLFLIPSILLYHSYPPPPHLLHVTTITTGTTTSITSSIPSCLPPSGMSKVPALISAAPKLPPPAPTITPNTANLPNHLEGAGDSVNHSTSDKVVRTSVTYYLREQ